MQIMFTVESAAAFEDIMRVTPDLLSLPEIHQSAWPASFVTGRSVLAVDYLRAQRARRQLIDAWEQSLAPYDVILSPRFGDDDYECTNLTGHPAITVKCGFIDGKLLGMTFVGHLYDESTLLSVAHAYEQATNWHTMHPTVT
jgi:Asp-tRNA(Asn)/Glu-tRNA(Gln) amidotransferase A subunit family amidase